jgi:CHAT domain-containing protein/Flp pilus assembly protein TadD
MNLNLRTTPVRLLMLIAFVIAGHTASCQGFLNKIKKAAENPQDALKDKAKEQVKEAADKEAAKAEAAEQSALIYSITLAEDAGTFEARENASKILSKLLGALAGGAGSSLLTGDRPSLSTTATELATDRLTEPDSVKARRLINTGEWLYRQGSYRTARSTFESAAALHAKDGDTLATGYARALGDLGLTYQALGRLDRADSCLTRALRVRRIAEDEGGPGTYAAINNLAVVAQRRGRFEQAETLLAEAAEGLSRANRIEAQAIALNNQAMLKYALGQNDVADQLLRRAFNLADGVGGAKAVLPIQLLGNRALVAFAQGRFKSADSLYDIAISRQERRLGGRSHPDIARLLNGRAALYLQMGRTAEVEPLLKQALGIYQGKFGTAHPTTAAIQHNLGSLYRVTDRLPDAEASLKAALATRQSLFSANHPDVIESQEALALTSWQAGKASDATAAYRPLVNNLLANATRLFAAMSEPEKARYWATLRPRFERFTNYALATAKEDPSLLADAYNLQLASKGILLNSATQLREHLLSSPDPKVASLFAAWQRTSEELAHAYTLSREELDASGLKLDSLELARNGLEKRLSAANADFASAVTAKAPTWQGVAATLIPGSTAIEIVRVREWNKQFTGRVVYAAFVAKPGATAPTAVSTPEGLDLEGKALLRYRRAIKAKAEDDQSYAAYWAWLAPALEGNKTAFIAPDGVYNQISLGTLKGPSGYVIEALTVSTVVSTRDLITAKSAKPNLTKTATLVGDADFGLIASASGSTERATETTIAALPGTLTEVNGIQAQLKAAGWVPTVFTKAQATEGKLKSLKAPRVLHVATHGFFLPDVSTDGGLVFGVQPDRAAENPLLRSGLLLTGAERTMQKVEGASPLPGDNGVLTAFEAMSLNLRGSDLVVLSACETGLGEVQAGEGVFGLQRALQLSGARSLVFSLWRVDDAASQELMTKFYGYWLAGRPLASAFRQAQLDLRAKYPQPYYWGAFVLIGV